MRKAEGFVTAVDSLRMQAKVRFPEHEDIESDWLQIGFQGAFSYLPLSKNMLVGCVMDDSFEDGWIVCRLHPDEQQFKETGEDVFFQEFSDGTLLKYDQKKHELTAEVKGTAKIKADKEIVLEGKIKIKGTLEVSETITATKDIESKTKVKGVEVEDFKGTLMKLRLAHKFHTHPPAAPTNPVVIQMPITTE